MAGLTDEDLAYFAREQTAHEAVYLAGSNPREQSGFGRDESDWRRYREVVLAPVQSDGTFLDIGCANGHLMESLVAWGAERGRAVEPFGLDISPPLVDLARARLPHWRDRIFLGNALNWQPPRTFDYVRTELVHVPRRLRPELVHHLLSNVVTPGGLLIVVSYGSSRPEGERAESVVDELTALPFPIVRVDDACSEQHGFVVTRAVSLTAST